MGQTTISVSDETLARFKRLKTDATPEQLPEQSADLFVQSLMDEWERTGDVDDVAETFGDALTDEEVAIVGRGADIERLAELVSEAGDGTALDYDDVVQATRQAIREELPVEAMGR